MYGTPCLMAAAARFARRLRHHASTGWQRCPASPTPRRVAAARLARQCTPRTAAGPRVPSALISSTMIQHHIFMIGSGTEARARKFKSTSRHRTRAGYASRDTGACRPTTCMKTIGQDVCRRLHAAETLAAAPRVAWWRRHALPSAWMVRLVRRWGTSTERADLNDYDPTHTYS